jgi:hypothetical protein
MNVDTMEQQYICIYKYKKKKDKLQSAEIKFLDKKTVT